MSLFLFPALLLVSWVAGLVRGQPIAAAGDWAAGAYAVGLLLSAWGVFVRRRWVRVRTVDVDIPGLSPSFEGYRIAQLSDLHIGSMCPRPVGDGWVSRVNGLDVDMVALTGDYVRRDEELGATREGVYVPTRFQDQAGAGLRLTQPLFNLCVFNAFGCHRQAKAVTKAGDGIDDGRTFSIFED